MILAQAFSRFAFDLDGVVWKGDRPIAGAPDTIRTLRDAGKRVAGGLGDHVVGRCDDQR